MAMLSELDYHGVSGPSKLIIYHVSFNALQIYFMYVVARLR